MILKIFTKIGKDRQPVVTLNEFKTKYFESDEIKIDLPEGNGHIAKYYIVFNNEEVSSGDIDLDVQGFELTNSQGELIERVITKKNL